MPKTKKPRKKYTPKPKARVLNKVPHCKVCGTDTRLATNAELSHFKAADPNFNLPFLFLPQCECWQIEDEWMVL